MRPGRARAAGFTLIEMLIVMALVAMLLTLALPRYFSGIERTKETVLMENLRMTREAIDRFHGDQGRYPDSLRELVDRKYLRSLPLDPVLDQRGAWIVVPPEPPERGGVADLRSAAPGSTQDGKAYTSL